MSIESEANSYKHNSELLFLCGGVVYMENLVMPYRGKPNIANIYKSVHCDELAVYMDFLLQCFHSCDKFPCRLNKSQEN